MKLPKYFICSGEALLMSKNIKIIKSIQGFDFDDFDQEIIVLLDKKYRGKYNIIDDIYILEYTKNKNCWIKISNNTEVFLQIIQILEEY